MYEETLYYYSTQEIMAWVALFLILGTCFGVTIPYFAERIMERRQARVDELEEIRKEHEALMLALKNIMERSDV